MSDKCREVYAGHGHDRAMGYKYRRLDKDGRDVSDLPGLWDESDCEIKMTNYPHPSITSGQHTNGPYSVWIRLPDGGVDWIRSRERTVHHTVKAWIEMGIDWFTEVEHER